MITWGVSTQWGLGQTCTALGFLPSVTLCLSPMNKDIENPRNKKPFEAVVVVSVFEYEHESASS